MADRPGPGDATPGNPDPGDGPAGGGGSVPGVGVLLQLGLTCGISIGLGMLLGWALDSALGTAPLLVFVGLAIGIVGAATGSYYLIRPYVKG